MKKILYKLGSFLILGVLLINSVKAQLPLGYGDLAVTYKWAMQSTSYTNSVLAILRTRNTSQAIPGEVWRLLGIGGTKPAWWSHPDWIVENLGDIFGITIDNHGNIYVSSTTIYGAGASPAIYRIDGLTGVYSQIPFPAVMLGIGSFGNIKFTEIGGNGYLYVSDWGNGLNGKGQIHKFKNTGNQNTPDLSSDWSYGSSFNPEFGRTGGGGDRYSNGQLPYGLAIRNTPTGKVLYYSRIGKYSCRWGLNNCPPSSGTTIANTIWSAQLDNSPGMTEGDVIGTETLQTLLSSVILQFDNPIADIAFTKDGQRMLFGQQSLCNLTCLGSHKSEVIEVVESSTNNWGPSGNLFPTGNTYSTYIHQSNAVGGISYSNNVIYTNPEKDNTKYGCDSTVWVVTDFMKNIAVGSMLTPPLTNPAVYGLQGYHHTGIQPYVSPTNITYQTSLLIDEDDDYLLMDKAWLGDVEVFNKPMEDCNPCTCRGWQSEPTLNSNTIPLGTSSPPPLNYPIQFIQGNVSGLINATYLCTGICLAEYTWEISKDGTSGPPVAIGNSLPIDLSQYNLSDCGKYTLTIKAKCGNSDCQSLVIPITIICEPPSCCNDDKITINLDDHILTTVTNIPNPNAVSEASLYFTLNYSLPMSEIRVSVEEFRLSSPTSPNCLNCNNRPVTWGNILTANLNGFPMTLSGLPGPPTGSLPADYREAVYNTGTPVMPTSAALNMQLSLPAITDLSCCEVDAYICLKFTFIDTQCMECVIIVCGTIKLLDPGVLTDTKKKKLEIKKFNVRH